YECLTRSESPSGLISARYLQVLASELVRLTSSKFNPRIADLPRVVKTLVSFTSLKRFANINPAKPEKIEIITAKNACTKDKLTGGAVVDSRTCPDDTAAEQTMRLIVSTSRIITHGLQATAKN